MAENMQELDNIITLNDENGNEVEFEFLDVIEYHEKNYVVLLPLEDEEEEVVILEVEQTDEDSEMENFVAVEDEETLMTVFKIFKEKFKDEFNFAD